MEQKPPAQERQGMCVYTYFYIHISTSPKNNRSNKDMATHHFHLNASNHL